jgi:pSer/pThr/pTyr-binding forkhead associated (FHA) protein
VAQSGKFKLTLVNTQSSAPPKEFELTKSELVVGRDEGVDIIIATPAVSRRHARFMMQGGEYIIEDLGSSNGTFVNGDRLIGRQTLNHRDEIRLGQAITLLYTTPTEADEPNATVVGAKKTDTGRRFACGANYHRR